MKCSPTNAVPKRINTVSHMIKLLNTEFTVSDTEDEASLTDTEKAQASGLAAKRQEVRDGPKNQTSHIEDTAPEDDDDSDWTTDGEATGTGSSDLYSVEEETLGYVTLEDGSMLGDIVNQAVIEAALEGLKFVDNDEIQSMDRARKRIILHNSGLTDLCWMQLKRLVDKIDVGTVLLDRLDQDL
ncbi:hypothetical protein H1R20_g16309, partial [Candolleomyces eurysporus]